MSKHDLKITWLTQGGFLFEQDSYRLVIDPYLSDAAEQQLGWTRLVQPPIDVDELKPSAVLCTHDHLDHLDPIALPLVMHQYTDCRLLGPSSVIKLATELGVEASRTAKLDCGQTTELGPFKATATKASHSDPDAVGFLISTPDHEVYISGDSRYSPELADKIAGACSEGLDLALVCINGRMNNMTFQEALQLVSQLQPTLTAPMHYGLFKENTIDPQPFIQGCRPLGLNCMLFEPGRPISLVQAMKGGQA
jgi:L-ascorbate metabolism protein UlaG (beta-lactamase superfamily)